MVYVNSTAQLRQDLQAVIMQGRGNNKSLICDKIFPIYGINKKTCRLLNLTIPGFEFMRIMDKVVEPGSNVERITLSLDGADYSVVIRKEEVPIPDEIDLEYSDYFPVEATATMLMGDKIALTREYLTAAQLFNTTNFGSATNSAVAYTVANLATISAIADIQDSIVRVKAKGEIPNTIVMSEIVWNRIRRATLVQNFIIGALGAGKDVNPSNFQKAFEENGITQVLIGGSVYNNAAPKATASISWVWNNTYIWVGRAGDPAEEQVEGITCINGAGATLYWEEYGQRTVETYRQEDIESNIVRGKTSEVPTVVNGNAGDLIATQYS